MLVYAVRCGLVDSVTIQARGTQHVYANFPPELKESPRLLYAPASIVINNPKEAIRFDSSVSQVELSRCEILIDAPKLNLTVSGNYLILPKNDVHFETGAFNTAVLEKQPTENVRQRILFTRDFDAPPIVRCWIQGFDCTSSDPANYQLSISAAGINSNAFTLTASSEKQFVSANIGWLAYDSNEDGKRVRSGIIDIPDSTERRKPETALPVASPKIGLEVSASYEAGRAVRSGIVDSPEQRKREIELGFTSAPFAKVPATFVGCTGFTGDGTRTDFKWKAHVNEVTQYRMHAAFGVSDNSTSLKHQSYV